MSKRGMSKAWERAIRAARDADRKTRAQLGDCRCAGPDYHPDKPCPVHPKVTPRNPGTDP